MTLRTTLRGATRRPAPRSALLGLLALPAALLLTPVGCVESEVEGLARAPRARTTVRMDFLHRPLPEIPLPNDLATRYDADSPTGRRLNASLIAPSAFERRTRALLDGLDGWGAFAPISIPFTGPLDLASLAWRHVGDDYATDNDAIYLVDVTEGSPTFGEPTPLDVGNGNFPLVLEQLDGYWEGDSRGDTLTLYYDEENEDGNGNGRLDQGEDTDLDGVLDLPNYVSPDGRSWRDMSLVERADAIPTHWERETNTLSVRPLLPLRERTTYAVVVTRRCLDADGRSVGSPYPFVNHTDQTDALRPLESILRLRPEIYGGLVPASIAFAWTFTTGTMESDFRAVRDGLYGAGVQAHLRTEFPPDVDTLYPLVEEPTALEGAFSMSGERFLGVLQGLIDQGVVSYREGPVRDRLMQSLRYVDRHIVGSYLSPQLMARRDDEGNVLGWNEMVWPNDLDRLQAEARPERVTFWLTLPREEVSQRSAGKPAGLVILGHGYGSSKTDLLAFHGFFARYGLAVLAIDNVSHGFGLGDGERALFDSLTATLGVRGFGDAILNNRSWDQNLDGVEDSGADFWSAYVFHTRDVVRQTAVDYMHLIRILRAWDGRRTWPVDMDGNGALDDIAGDFDGDGFVDVGGPDGPIQMVGGSLGGIMTGVVAGLEPHLGAAVPIAGAGSLFEVANRSTQGGVRESVHLRVMGPMYVGAPDPGSGAISIRTIVPDLNGVARFDVAQLSPDVVDAVAGGGAVLAENLSNGEYDCALLKPDAACLSACGADARCIARCLTFRVGLASDVIEAPSRRQRHRLRFFAGNPFLPGVRDPERHKACALRPDAEAVHTVEEFGADVDFHFCSRPLAFRVGEPLSPVAEGLGLHRARPELRRLSVIGQLVLDRADPAVYAPNWLGGRMWYGTGEVVETHTLVVNSIGDTNVPVAGGAAMGRAGGLLDFETPVAEWGGRTVNQVLIDSYVLEGVDKIPRFVDPSGRGVLFDPENLSGSPAEPLPPAGRRVAWDEPAPRGNDGYHAPRLDPPLNSRAVGQDALGGVSGTLFPYVVPGGSHGFHFPGEDAQRLDRECRAAAAGAGRSDTECDGQRWFDHGSMLISAIGRYVASGGTLFQLRECASDFSCDERPPPAPRE